MSLALALNRSGLKICLVDAQQQVASKPEKLVESGRILALSYGSRQILDSIGVWDHLLSSVQPINKIHVSQQGYFGATRILSQEENVEALGYVLSQSQLELVLQQALQQTEVVQLKPASLAGLTQSETFASLDISSADGMQKLQTKLVVLAAGTNPELSAQLGIKTKLHDYQQTALVASLAIEKPHLGTAFERFTDTGPLALLPLSSGRMALVLTLPDASAEQAMAMSSIEFLGLLQSRFGHQLGHFSELSKRAAFKLQMRSCEQRLGQRCVLLGNAVRQLHPVAGQGLNLALRDVAELAASLQQAARLKKDLGDDSIVQEFLRHRRNDQRYTVGLTHGLVQSFASFWRPVAWARAAGLLAMDLLPPLRHRLARQMLGLNGRLPSLRADPPTS